MTDGYNPEDPALSSSKSDFLPVPLMLPMGQFRPLPPHIPGIMSFLKNIPGKFIHANN